jgi:hypothetical protein
MARKRSQMMLYKSICSSVFSAKMRAPMPTERVQGNRRIEYLRLQKNIDLGCVLPRRQRAGEHYKLVEFSDRTPVLQIYSNLVMCRRLVGVLSGFAKSVWPLALSTRFDVRPETRAIIAMEVLEKENETLQLIAGAGRALPAQSPLSRQSQPQKWALAPEAISLAGTRMIWTAFGSHRSRSRQHR